MRPDRIVVGECRAGEALDMIQAMTTGHEGSLSTGHANTPRDMLRRLETMILMTGYDLPLRAIREQIASAVDVIVHTARLRDGSRKIVSITEIHGIEDDDILTQEIFAFEQTGFRDGRVEGALKPTGIRPHFMRAFRTRGVPLPPGEYGIPPEDPTRPAPAGGKARWGATAPDPHHRGPELARRTGARRRRRRHGLRLGRGPGRPRRRVVYRAARSGSRHASAWRTSRPGSRRPGSSLDKVVWANWSLREPTEFDAFYEEWLRWFPEEAPVGQGTLMPLAHRRAGFRISIGVIASA